MLTYVDRNTATNYHVNSQWCLHRVGCFVIGVVRMDSSPGKPFDFFVKAIETRFC